MLTEEQHFELLRNCKIGGDGMEYQEIDIEIDSLTNCLVSKDGKEFDTEYKEFRKNITAVDAKKLQKDGWVFDWSKPQKDGYSVYGLYIVGSEELEGLIAFRQDRENYFT